MKKAILLSVTIALLLITQFSLKSPENDTVVSGGIRNYILSENDSIILFLNKSKSCRFEKADLIPLYSGMRKHYKHIEFFIEYFSPREAKYVINGPLVYKHDEENGRMERPQGFQKLEEYLFSDIRLPEHAIFESELDLLIHTFNNLRTYYEHVEIHPGLMLELFQLEIYRIASLNMNGYDATLSAQGIKECGWSIEGIISAVGFYKVYKNEISFRRVIACAETVRSELLNEQDYIHCDRLKIITRYLQPLNAAIVNFHNICNFSWNTNKQALVLNSKSLFTKYNFNVRYFSIYYDDTLNLQEQAALGKKLFFDPLLSANNKRSCASCHSPAKHYTDGLRLNSSLDRTTSLLRNTPSLNNVLFQKAFFYDGRAYQLEQQIADVVGNKLEMHGNLDSIIIKLRENSDYVKLFESAFRNTTEAGINPYSVQKAITEFEKTLIVFDSRFDEYLNGNNHALNKREINGYNLFAGKALCGSCHFFPLFNGTVPPFYNDSEFEVLGVPETAENKALDRDPGRQAVTGFNEQLHAFKTPGLRNVEYTAPYMHNGVYRTLDEVINFYHKGGGQGLGYDVENQTLPFDSLNLNDNEKGDVILFLKSLSSKENQ
jgi:cytochrome c peroxidase